ncbi:MAG: putative toxin-antitoxin system toxin component, PIN family [Desulfovermiculus sp.]
MDVVIDTNVVISGLLFSGLPGRIVALWQKKVIVPYVSKDIIDEYVRVLAYPKFQLTQQDIEYLLYQEILKYCEIIIPGTDIQVVSEDPADDMFIHCALAKSINTIISGDRHLLALESYKSISVLPPAEFLQRLCL